MKREKMKNKEKAVLHLRAGRETVGACFRRFVGEDQGSNDDISDNQYLACMRSAATCTTPNTPQFIPPPFLVLHKDDK